MSNLWNKSPQGAGLDLPPAKRISTPAGQRLSVILENGATAPARPKEAYRSSMKKGTFGLGEAPRESLEDGPHGSSYSYSAWSETSGEKLYDLKDIKNNKQVSKRGGWKRLALIVAVLLTIIVAIVIGVVVGTRKKHSGSKSSENENSNPAQTSAASNAITPGAATATPTATASLSPTSTPSNFPVGSYSLVTFLDTVQTNCTANPDTWTCYPYTDFNTDPNKSIATFNWIITSPKANTFAISSTDNPFSISFSNTPLELLDEGLSTERYRFQLDATNKQVSPSGSLTSDNAAVTCFYNSTTLQAYLYTKMASSFPDASKGENSGNPSFPVWPFAVRVEQAIGGGQDVPNCWTLHNGVPDQQITDGLQAQAQGELCSCLYKNWRTPGVY
ncbi:uncharacterized protein BDZ99DRAFT_504509 [Mytilinidion resinicola]|uniref:Tat pathway signal sequence n=1 Tax=Mytilinidion resinicola TaxID=574789 RepID=A0A6A6XYE9_9PEZI|nr:uncharacterized protein BDZ99DRAFT_504509 [Mytilinidion resinicola]KAF2801571.1 hypothetical protein BDZ99DRAFT_504509 [Mytilinidion resinicola]